MATPPFMSGRADRIYITAAAVMCCLCSVAVAMGVGGLCWSLLEWLGFSKGICGLVSLGMASAVGLVLALEFPPEIRRILRGGKPN